MAAAAWPGSWPWQATTSLLSLEEASRMMLSRWYYVIARSLQICAERRWMGWTTIAASGSVGLIPQKVACI